MLLVLLACEPAAGTYLLETTEWATTCSVASGPYEEPAAQYEVEVWLEGADALWLDEVPCERDGMDYSCPTDPVEEPAGSDASYRITREWSGAWEKRTHMHGTIAWSTTCEGSGCSSLDVDLCDATWTYSAINIEEAE
jgi:hypothetical protein